MTRSTANNNNARWFKIALVIFVVLVGLVDRRLSSLEARMRCMELQMMAICSKLDIELPDTVLNIEAIQGRTGSLRLPEPEPAGG